MMKISPSKAAELVFVVDSWLSGRFSNMLPIKLSTFSNYFLENEQIEAAIKILDYIVTPILAPDSEKYSKYRSLIRFRSDHYWVNEYCEKEVQKLNALKPLSVLAIFENKLEKAIELTKQVDKKEAEKKVGYYWRLDIPNRSSDRDDADALDILIDEFRDALVLVCKELPDEGSKFLKSFLNSDHFIFKRIAIFALQFYGQNYPELLNSVLLNRNLLEDGVYFTEYRSLLRVQFANASEEAKSTVISWILEGPLDIEERVIRHSSQSNREVSDEDRNKELEEWMLF